MGVCSAALTHVEIQRKAGLTGATNIARKNYVMRRTSRITMIIFMNEFENGTEVRRFDSVFQWSGAQ